METAPNMRGLSPNTQMSGTRLKPKGNGDVSSDTRLATLSEDVRNAVEAERQWRHYSDSTEEAVGTELSGTRLKPKGNGDAMGSPRLKEESMQ